MPGPASIMGLFAKIIKKLYLNPLKLLPTNCLSASNHFVGLALKVLKFRLGSDYQVNVPGRLIQS